MGSGTPSAAPTAGAPPRKTKSSSSPAALVLACLGIIFLSWAAAFGMLMWSHTRMAMLGERALASAWSQVSQGHHAEQPAAYLRPARTDCGMELVARLAVARRSNGPTAVDWVIHSARYQHDRQAVSQQLVDDRTRPFSSTQNLRLLCDDCPAPTN